MPVSFITNYGEVIALIAQHGRITARRISMELGITERSVLRIIGDLETGGYLDRRREGRANWYEVNRHLPLYPSEERDTAVGELLKVLVPADSADK